MTATNVTLFHVLNEMLLVLDPARLDEGGAIEETIKNNKAHYHQSCCSLKPDQNGAWSQAQANKRMQILSNWRNFLRDNYNKTDLFNFLGDKN